MGAHTYKPGGAEIELKVRKTELKSPFIHCTSEVIDVIKSVKTEIQPDEPKRYAACFYSAIQFKSLIILM